MNISLQMIAAWAVSFLLGGTASPVIEWLKNKLGWEDGNATILTAVASTLFAILSLWANGEILPGTLGFADFPSVLFLVGVGATVVFRKWIKK